MSRVYHNPPASTARRPPPSSTARPPPPPPARSPQRSIPTTSTTNRGMTRGVRPPIRGRTMQTQPPRPEINENDPYKEDDRTSQQDRVTHVGDGYHMFTPATTKREQMRRQAENEQRQYEVHIERSRLHGIHEVHRLGGDEISEDEVRRRQAEKYRREKLTRLEKTHQDQFQKKQEEERDLEAKKQAARHQSMENEKRDRQVPRRSMKPTTDQEATGWTDETREQDRRETMDRFLNRMTQQYDDMNISSDDNQKNDDHNTSKSEKLSILRDMLPHIDDQTLEYYLEIYNGNVDAIVHELLN